MASNLTRSEQLKRKAQRKPTENFDTDESEKDDDDFQRRRALLKTCLLIAFEEKEGKKDFAVVKKSEVQVLSSNLDKGIFKYRGKSYVVDILKRGKALFLI